MKNHALKQVTGNCEFCDKVNVVLSQNHGDMMCDSCIALENDALARQSANAKVEQVITESNQSSKSDAKIQLKQDVFTAVTTSFIELHGAILNNPDVPAEQKKYELAREAAKKIQELDAAIFAHDEVGVAMKNQRLGWLKNLQPLVSTLKIEEQAKFKQFNMNYKPAEPTVAKVKKVAKAGKVPVASGKRYTINQVKEACEKAGVDRAIISNMMLSRSNANLTLDEVIQKHLRIEAN